MERFLYRCVVIKLSRMKVETIPFIPKVCTKNIIEVLF